MNPFMSKVQRKLNQCKNRFIPYNYKYRPKQLAASSKKYAEECKQAYLECHEIAMEQVYKLPIPDDLYDCLTPYQLVDGRDEDSETTLVTKNDYFIDVIPEGRLYTDNLFLVWVMTKENKLLGDVSFQFHNDYPVEPTQNLIIRQSFFKQPKRIPGVVCTLLNGGGGVSNYYHWMIDILPRIHFLKQTGWLDKIDYFVVPNYKYDFQKDSLRLLGIEQDRIIAAEPEMHIQADQLVATSHPRNMKSILVPQWISDFHQRAFIHLTDRKKKTPSRIYISRLDSKNRPIYNERELIAFLESEGFTTYILSKLSFLEKVQLFANAEVVVSPSGAGITSLMYCKPGTKLLEIFGGGRAHTYYYNLAHNAGLKYHFVTGNSQGDIKKIKSRTEGIKKGYSLDIPQVQEKLREMLNDEDDS
jgi:capsular polysaccharide biosynthesis protein